ncbi:MAG TPA: hypothetical protein VFW94_24290 [Candidatus Acidoferrales bacterium]|nr:hypothetical protein [Candidatus Acidoferrales bacterium]
MRIDRLRLLLPFLLLLRVLRAQSLNQLGDMIIFHIAREGNDPDVGNMHNLML